MFKLANAMSFVLAAVTYGMYPRKFVQLEITLVPTPGASAPDPDTIEKYGVNHALFFTATNADTKAVARTLLGEPASTVRQWIKAEFAKYTAGEAYEMQLAPIFEYISEVGLEKGGVG